MQTELKIKEILNSSISTEKKIDEIRKFMDWDKKKLKNAIIRHGTSGKEGRDAIVEEFWADCSEEKRRKI